MKKVYEKPQFMFESFEMSTNIASGCQHTNVTYSSGQTGCGYQVGGDRFNNETTIFTSEVSCEATQDDGVYNGICYHVPTAGNNIFNS